MDFSISDFRYACPECNGDAIEYSRVCFGVDSHVDYRCVRCHWSGRNPKFILVRHDEYGDPPVPILDLALPEWQEFMTYQYLPVRLPQREGFQNTTIALPKRLEFLHEAVAAAWSDATVFGFDDPYIYVTAKRGWATHDNPLNRKGWHCDGFGTDDLNYAWCDAFPTLFAPWSFEDISDDHIESLVQFETQTRHRGMPKQIDTNTLYRFTPYVVHAATSFIVHPGGMRSFLKVSVSNHRYNLIGNSHNYELDYDWTMYPRDMLRNDPHKAGLDFVEE